MKDTPKVIGLGFACLDHVLRFEDCEKPVVGNRVLGYEIQGGGLTGTALVAAARLGARAEFWGVVGRDATADMVLNGLVQEGVDVSHVQRADGDGPVCPSGGVTRSGNRSAGAASCWARGLGWDLLRRRRQVCRHVRS